MPRPIDPLILQAALVGLEAQHQRIEEMIAQVRRMAGAGSAVARAVPVAAPRKKRRLSPAGRKRILAALKKRWAEYRKQKAAAGSKPKR